MLTKDVINHSGGSRSRPATDYPVELRHQRRLLDAGASRDHVAADVTPFSDAGAYHERGLAGDVPSRPHFQAAPCGCYYTQVAAGFCSESPQGN